MMAGGCVETARSRMQSRLTILIQKGCLGHWGILRVTKFFVCWGRIVQGLESRDCYFFHLLSFLIVVMRVTRD